MIDAILLFPTKNIQSTLILRGDFFVKYFYACISNVKDYLINLKNEDKSNNREELTYYLGLNLKEINTYICNADDLNDKTMKNIHKRSILKPLSLQFETKEFMSYVDGEFKLSGGMDFKGTEIFLTISYQDIVNIANAFVYNMKMLDKEYFEKINSLNKLKNQWSIIEEDKSNYINSQYINSEFIPFEQAPENLRKSEIYQPLAADAKIFTVLDEAMKVMDRLGKASKDMKKYKMRAMEYTQMGSKSSQKSNELQRQSRIYSHIHEEFKAINSKDFQTRISGRFASASNPQEMVKPNDSKVYERLKDTSEMKFDSIKMVVFPYMIDIYERLQRDLLSNFKLESI